MEKITNSIAQKISSELKYNDEKSQVIKYGMFILIQTIFSILLVGIIGALLGVMVESLIISFTGSILRKYSGGAHATSAERCTIMGVIICVGLALICIKISQNITLNNMALLGIIVITVSYFTIYKLAPIDNPMKPIKTHKKRTRMKKLSFFILSVYVVIVIALLALQIFFKTNVFETVILSIYAGIAWQMFTLTKIGHILTNKIDMLLK
ncbi:MAG: accessory gene regulator B family protein [Clostridium sp.]